MGDSEATERQDREPEARGVALVAGVPRPPRVFGADLDDKYSGMCPESWME